MAANHTNILLRPMTLPDFTDVHRLIREFDESSIGHAGLTLEEMRSDWLGRARFELERDAVIAVTPAGETVGFSAVFEYRDPPVRPFLWGVVAPPYRGQGIGATLLEWSIDRARKAIPHVPDEARVVLQATAFGAHEFTKHALTRHGFSYAGSFYAMRITLDTAPEPAKFPDGIRLITYADRPDPRMFAYVYGHSFADHRGWLIRWTMEHPLHRVNDLLSWPDTDPTLIFFLMDGDMPVGLLTVHPSDEDDPDYAHTHWLAIMPGYRRQGLARQLLQHAFVTAHALGRKGLTLNVDASSLTNAVHLYESAGMHAKYQWDSYHLELRSGIEYTRQ
ncbi:MAG: GNAT family N-acetyltransferase [Phototrophicaceae bacterium]|nr:Mycothiol acetyltransferase [Anaerolineae bacterium]